MITQKNITTRWSKGQRGRAPSGKMEKNIHQIKNHRRRTDYKARVKWLRAEREEAAADTEELGAFGLSQDPEEVADALLPTHLNGGREVFGGDTGEKCAILYFVKIST